MTFARFLHENAPYLTAGALLTFVSSFGQTFFISMFAGEIRAEFGLSHGGWGTIYAVGTMVSAAVMVWAGALTDIVRVRILAIFVLGGLAAACLLMAALPVLWGLPVVIFFLRLFGQGMSGHIATVAMARWFVAARGRALSIASIGFSVGEACLPIIFVALLAVTPWRLLWVVAAIIALLILPVVVRLLRAVRTPQSVAKETNAVGMQGRQWSRTDAVGHWLFWVMVPVIIGPSAFGTAFFFHQVHLAEVKGWTHLEFVALFPIYTVTGIAALLGSGWLIDRFGTAWLMPFAQIPVALGFFILGGTGSLWGATAAVILMGLTFGANATLPAAFWAEFYGTRHLGAIKALATAVMVLGSAIGPGLTGMLIDRGILFPDQMVGIGLWFLAVTAMLTLALSKARKLLPQPA
ncbi:MAG: MFS transporter [Pseudomonadota bacterium]